MSYDLDKDLANISKKLGREFTNRELGVIKVMRKYPSFKPYIFEGGLRFEKENKNGM